jgi:hypothetical protein
MNYEHNEYFMRLFFDDQVAFLGVTQKGDMWRAYA